MERPGDRVCVIICLLAMAYLLWHMIRAGWL